MTDYAYLIAEARAEATIMRSQGRTGWASTIESLAHALEVSGRPVTEMHGFTPRDPSKWPEVDYEYAVQSGHLSLKDWDGYVPITMDEDHATKTRDGLMKRWPEDKWKLLRRRKAGEWEELK